MMASHLEGDQESRAIRLLDEYFSASWLDGLCEHEIPLETWEQALLGPVREVLSAPGRRFRGRLVELAWTLSGATGSPPPLLGFLVEVIHAGSLIVDDVQDGSHTRRGKPALHRVCGVPLAINAGGWLYFWSHELVSRLGLPQSRELELRRRMSRAQLLAHYGQGLDLSLRASELAQNELMPLAQNIARLKTGSLAELATTLGAVAAGAKRNEVEPIAEFGREVGMALQHLDDLGGILSERRREKGWEDVEQDRVTFAWAYAAAHMSSDSFARLQEARRVLDRSGPCGAADAGSAVDAGRTPDGGRTPSIETVCSALRETALDGARGVVHERLQRVLGALQQQFGPNSTIREVGREIERLEQAYG